MTAHDPAALATTYFESWKDKDFDTLRSILADDASFRGPLGTADDADSCIKGLRMMAEMITDIDIQKMWVDGPDVITWFDLHTTEAPPSPTVNWSHVENGLIARIRVTFDPRSLLPPGHEGS
jgi:hypothetical protein